MSRALILALVALSACSFHPKVPTGTVSCQTSAECPAGLTCQASADTRGGRRCCGPSGCPAPSVDAGAVKADAAPPPPGPAPTPGTDAAGAGDDAAVVVVASPDAGRVDAAAADTAPVNAAALVTCTPPVTGPLPAVTGRRSYCSIGLLDRVALLGVDTLDGQDETGAGTVQSCAASLDLAGKTKGGTLPAGDLEVLVAIVRHYQGLCTQLKVDEVVGVYAAGWARQIPDAGAAIKTALQSAAGLDLEVLTADQEVLQRYLGTSRNRRGRLVVHARGTDLQIGSWVDGAMGPTELTVAANLPRADAMFFTNAQVTGYQDGRRQYGDALRAELDSAITGWRQLMNQGRLDRSLTADTDDATLALAVNGTSLRAGNGTWTDVATWSKVVAAAPIMADNTYGRSFDVIAFRDLTRFVGSIDNAQFEQLRREPIHSAYGLQVMGQGAVFEVLVRDLPITEMGQVPSSSSLGYLFRKRFTPR